MHSGKLMGPYQFNPVAISHCQFLMILDALVEVGKVLLVNGKVAKGLNRTAGGRRGTCTLYSCRVDLIALLGNRLLGSGFLADFRLQGVVAVLERLRVPARLSACRKQLHHLVVQAVPGNDLGRQVAGKIIGFCVVSYLRMIHVVLVLGSFMLIELPLNSA